MSLRDWPTQRIRRLWFGGGLLELALIVIPVTYAVIGSISSRRGRGPVDSVPNWPSANRLTPAQLDSLSHRAHAALDSMGARLDSSGDTAVLHLNDSMAISLVKRGDTIQSIRLSPAAHREVDRAVGPILNALGEASEAAWRQFLLIITLVYLPIPLVLTTVTVAWVVQKRQSRRLTSA